MPAVCINRWPCLLAVQVSGDQKVLVASFYAHHLCVFDIESQKHTQTLENEHSLLLLHVAALTWDGAHLVHANYDERDKVSDGDAGTACTINHNFFTCRIRRRSWHRFPAPSSKLCQSC